MSHSQLKVLPTVQVGSESVVVKRPSQSRVVVAHILRSFADANGLTERIVLDRLVHQPHEKEFEGWFVRGAVVTERHRSL